MDLTLLPYEILQLIASWLLPRHQCRLALVSRHHYRHLYTDLLRWHAKWHRQTPPIYKSLRGPHMSSIRIFMVYSPSRILIIRSYDRNLYSISNLTTGIYLNYINGKLHGNNAPAYSKAMLQMVLYWTFSINMEELPILRKYYNILHINCITILENLRQPIWQCPYDIRKKIYYSIPYGGLTTTVCIHINELFYS